MEQRKKSLRIIGIILVVVGVLTPFLYFIEHRNLLTGQVTGYDFPLLPYGFTIAIIGILLIVGAILIKEEVPLPPPPTPMPITRVCPNCGHVLAEDMKYCPYCGKAFVSN